MLPNHAPLVIAEQFGTLEALYPGRIDLGLGRAPGSDNLTAHALRRGLNATEDEFPRQVAELIAYLAPAKPGQRLRAFPGEGSNVPVWLLGSSLFSAQLAAMLGLPFAFASHFAPQLLLEALAIYREQFQPSAYLQKPYVMAGVPVVAAGSDAEAEHLATSVKMRHLSLIRGQPIFVEPPVGSMDGRWNEAEQRAVETRLRVAAIGGPETLRRRLSEILRLTEADELMFTSDLYDHGHRLRSFEMAAAAMREVSG
jgi:luciferase family oxidoreductase group 1